MGSKKTKETVLKVLEDTGYAYTLTCESHVNADYADFASTQALHAFKEALKNPDLTYDDLCAMLRKASSRASNRQCKTPWSMFMANYISKHSKVNAHKMPKIANSNGSGRIQ